MRILLLLLLASCATNSFITSSDLNNSEENIKKPYVLLISLDGYRHDYTEKYKPKFLTKFQQEGVGLKSLRPSYPTKTFPNHLSIITGRYPVNHGIIANRFFAPDLGKPYSLRSKEALTNSDFYTAKPLWVLAEEQHMKTATLFWPGSEAKIDGYYPSYYLKYDHHKPHNSSIETILGWLKLPEEKRPHLVTLYFHDIDSAGHKSGPNSEKVKLAIDSVDQSLEKLITEVEKLNLDINIVIVSDHGMTEVTEEKSENIVTSDEIKNSLQDYNIIGRGPILHFYKTNKEAKLKTNDLIKNLNAKAKHYKCYNDKNTPKKLHFSNNPRIGDIVCIAKMGWSIYHDKKSASGGNHGWSQYEGKNMHAIFYAKGKAFKSKKTFKTLDNIHIYPLLAKILDLKFDHKIDGDLNKIKHLLK